MRRPPPLQRIPEYPVTGGLCVLAVVTTLASWSQGPSSIEPLLMHPAAFHDEPWRLISSILPHGGLIHLGFNLYWTWIFGTIVEERLGIFATAGLVLLIGAGASAAEYALISGGMGLSGVLYGLFGLLWVLKGRDPRFLGTLDPGTTRLLVGWFFLCIVLTWLNILNIANVEHGAGAAIGAALGLGVAARTRAARLQALVLNLSWVLGIALAATVALPTVNLVGLGGRDLAYRGVLALEQGRSDEGLELLARSAEQGPPNPELWMRIGDGFMELGRPDRALEAYQRAGLRAVPELEPPEVAPPPGDGVTPPEDTEPGQSDEAPEGPTP